MLRLIMTATISLLISFGAISKSKSFSILVNHLTQDHASLSHDIHEHHHHHTHKHSKNTNNEKEHSHHLDLSLLVQFFTFEPYQNNTVIIPSSVGEVLVPLSPKTLLLTRYSLSIFRPPIA